MFTRIARAYLLSAGGLNWRQINPDIFGSMIQAVADDEERGALGMHYTSVPNILKVLNPLFLDDLRAQLEAAGDNKVKLLNLRRRMARIRVFDPACGSGNFLVIAYKQMREIEADINCRREEVNLRTEIPLTNFRGIELRDFPAEIARLALIIAEFQSDVLYRGQQEALAEVLPLDAKNWITCGNALRMDWLRLMDVDQAGVKLVGDDLFNAPLDQAEIDFENEGGETYICGNPPYKGGTKQSAEQKSDMAAVFSPFTASYKSLDYVSGWFFKFAQYAKHTKASCAFVSTNSIAQGEQVARLWPLIFDSGLDIIFAHTSFKWANLASYNAGVTVAIIGLGCKGPRKAVLFESGDGGTPLRREVENINPYLIPFRNLVVEARTDPISSVAKMVYGSKPVDGGNLIFGLDEAMAMRAVDKSIDEFIYRYVGATEAIDGSHRFCLWISDKDKDRAIAIPGISARIARVKAMREQSTKELTNKGAGSSWAFQQIRQTGNEEVIVVPAVSSEGREFLPCGLLPVGTIISNRNFGIFNAPLWNLAVLLSRFHWVWVDAVCGKLEMRFNYSNTLGWNTFPVPTLTEQNKADLTRCAEDIVLAREAHYPATIADLYDPETMPDDLRQAHERNDEVLERIYIGRRFRNDTERLEKLFALYTKMTANQAKPKKGGKAK